MDQYQKCLINRIDEDLFLTDYIGANNLYFLEELGIKRIISLGNEDEMKDYVKYDHIEYMNIIIDDREDANIEQYFAQTNKFISERKTPLLIHCRKGISRSVAIAIAYFMSKGMSYLSALYKIREVRPFVNPNIGFVEQLCKIEM